MNDINTLPTPIESSDVCHFAQFEIFTDSPVIAAIVAGRACKVKGKSYGYCIVHKKRVYWRLRTRKGGKS
ncbi:hypothetical protein SAMN05660964_03564 [Thiothrix caldifontis]|uniref:Uncharacterized protein n=1 Tax=Thiothrix caldifontis TaxID=525918 RepID=A0A1H4GNE3_9GAMM|nr:hypothetical protein [Thiothrix caldifontis]SEB10520.1 hypothetical protein SAMN05660964_03564 [Thiothrix caldifontis]